MGHEIKYFEHPENVDRKTVQAELDTFVRKMCWQEGAGGLHSPIRWIDHVCDCYEDAMEYIREHDNGWYDQLAVKYLDTPVSAPTKAMIDLQTRIRSEREKYAAYQQAHSVKSFKAEYIGCPRCGSKLKRELLRGECCPLCHTDLRSKTTIETLDRYDAKISELKQRYSDEERKLARKITSQTEVRWLVKIEYHT